MSKRKGKITANLCIFINLSVIYFIYTLKEIKPATAFLNLKQAQPFRPETDNSDFFFIVGGVLW